MSLYKNILQCMKGFRFLYQLSKFLFLYRAAFIFSTFKTKPKKKKKERKKTYFHQDGEKELINETPKIPEGRNREQF